jgi:hypothetical protein
MCYVQWKAKTTNQALHFLISKEWGVHHHHHHFKVANKIRDTLHAVPVIKGCWREDATEEGFERLGLFGGQAKIP